MDKLIKIYPYLVDQSSNEHFIVAVGGEFDSEDGETDGATSWDLLQIFPDGENRGSRIEIHRAPTQEELKQVEEYAVLRGAQVEFRVQSNEEWSERSQRERPKLR